MERAELVSSRNNGAALPPQIALDYDLSACNDVTAQAAENMPTDPNACVWQIECDTVTLDQIEADGWPILWRETIVEAP